MAKELIVGKWRTSLLVLLALALPVLLAMAGRGNAQGQASQRCFTETGFCIEGRIREFWERNGGLPIFGFPTGPQHEELIEGIPFQVQWFERNRLELHPDNPRPYAVLLGRLGAERLSQQHRDWQTYPKSEPHSGCRFFPETDHNVCGAILARWRANGLEFDGTPGMSEAENLALFGFPLSDPQIEMVSDGRQYVVQWFERARFELHPENAPPYDVLLGLLGNEVQANPGALTPTPTYTPTSTPSPTPTHKPHARPPKPTPPPYPIPIP
jgi:hypothetical protein